MSKDKITETMYITIVEGLTMEIIPNVVDDKCDIKSYTINFVTPSTLSGGFHSYINRSFYQEIPESLIHLFLDPYEVQRAKLDMFNNFCKYMRHMDLT